MQDTTSLKRQLIELNLTGQLNRNTPESNRQAIREMIARNSYWTFDAQRLLEEHLNYDAAAKIMASRLGMSDERFASDEPPYIEPDQTVEGLLAGFDRLEAAARAGDRVLLATAHPGSLLGFYTEIARYLVQLGASLAIPDEPISVPDNRWIDAVDGVLVLSDEGNLMHTHSDQGMKAAVELLKPNIAMGDHGFAMAAINAGVSTVALFDVDDPALPMMAEAHPDSVLAFPMNDNQTNHRSARAAAATIAFRKLVNSSQSHA